MGKKEKWHSPIKKNRTGEIERNNLSSTVITYKLPPEEIGRIFKDVKPEAPPSMIGVDTLKRKAKIEVEEESQTINPSLDPAWYVDVPKNIRKTINY